MGRLVELISTIQLGMGPKYNKSHISIFSGGVVGIS